jgi:hypothetical protein
MLNIIIYFPGPDSFSGRNLLGETVAWGVPLYRAVLRCVCGGVPRFRSLGRFGTLRAERKGLHLAHSKTSDHCLNTISALISERVVADRGRELP